MEDERFVRMALDNGNITSAQIARAREEQRQLADRGVERSVWFLLQDLGFINDDQVRNLRKCVSSSQIRALEVDGYTLQGRLGSGGMGDVFRATDASGHTAAVKLLSAKLARSIEHTRRFHREARASLRLHHPHVTRSLASGELDGQCYLIMELVEGPSLKQRIVEGGPLATDDALVLLWQMAQALSYAWRRGVLHRDVKPANIMIGPPRPGVAEPFCAKLCDFGLAKVWSDGQEHDVSHGGLTGTGLALGTPHYMAPEQASGERDLDQRADIYSLGAAVYHALLGQTMYSGRSSTAIMYKQVTEDVDLSPLSRLNLNPKMITLLGGMLHRKRDRRTPTWEHVIEAVENLAPIMSAAQKIALDAGRRSSSMDGVQSSASAIAVAPSTNATSIPTTAVVHPPVQINEPPTNQSPTSVKPVSVALLAAGAAVLVVAGAIAVMWSLGGEHLQTATPATFATTLANSSSGTVIDLAPGDYIGAWHLGVAQSGVTIRGAGPGVRLMTTTSEPALRLEPGLRRTRLRNLTIVSTEKTTVLEALGSSEAELEQVIVSGVLRISGGGIAVHQSHLENGAEVDGQGTLTITDSTVTGAPALHLRSGTTIIHHSRLTGNDAAHPAVIADSGELTCDAVVITAAVGTSSVLQLSSSSRAQLTDMVLSGASIGIDATGSHLEHIDGLTISASNVGLRWTGPRDPGWSWINIAITAPTPALGTDLGPVGNGARNQRLPPP